MMNVSHMLGLNPISWPTILLCAFVGLIVGIVLKTLIWRKTPGGLAISVYFALAGAGLGAFLGLCYYVIDPRNRMTF